MSVEVRPFEPGDNQELVALARGLAVPARVRLGVDRGPDFAAAVRAAGDRGELLVAEAAGGPAGFIDVRYREWQVRGRPVPVAYVALAGVAGGRRGGPAFVALMRAAEERARARGTRLAVALVNRSNPRLLDVLLGRFPGTRTAEPVAVDCLFAARHHPGRRWRCSEPTPAERAELFRLAASEGGECFAVERLTASVAGRQAGALRLWCARDRDGAVRAGIGVWDQREFRRILLLGLDPGLRLVRAGLAVARPLLGLPPLPRVGGELRAGFAVLAGGDAGGFRAVLRHALSAAAGTGQRLVLLGLPEGDRLRAAAGGLPRVVNTNAPVLIPLDSAMADALAGAGRLRVRPEYALG